MYKVKYNTDGSINRYKARLVATGYAQQHDIDYNETFALVAKITTVCVLLAIAAAKGCHLHQMDVKNAFLHVVSDEEHVYMVQPPGFQSGVNTSEVWRLKKSLYRLKQAPHSWNAKITQQSHQMGFATSKSDSLLFVRQGQHELISVLLYVDELVIVSTNLDEIGRDKSQLVASFDMKDLGDLHYFLGIEVIRSPEGILINKWYYVMSMLFKFRMTTCKSLSTPRDRNVKLRPDSGMACDPKRFRQIVESLIYLTLTRSDLSYPVIMINQFMAQPTVSIFSACNAYSGMSKALRTRGCYIRPVLPNN